MRTKEIKVYVDVDSVISKKGMFRVCLGDSTSRNTYNATLTVELPDRERVLSENYIRSIVRRWSNSKRVAENVINDIFGEE